jgi:hypothetical protein
VVVLFCCTADHDDENLIKANVGTNAPPVQQVSPWSLQQGGENAEATGRDPTASARQKLLLPVRDLTVQVGPGQPGREYSYERRLYPPKFKS